MDRQVVSSVWSYEPKYDLHIDKFLELLLKYEYVWREQDEKVFRISLSESKRILFAEDFCEFQEGLTSFDIAIQMKNIRKLYNEELAELKKAGKSENDSKLPWFSKAHSLFSDKTDREKEILKHEDSSVSSEGPPVSKSGVALPNFQEKSRKSPSLPPTHLLSSSKTAMVTLTPIMTSVLTTTTSSSLHSVNPFLMANPKPYAVRQPLTKTIDFTSANPVLKTTNRSANKSCLGAISKASIVSSPYEMTSNSLKIRHPFSPPTSISPVSRIPLRLPTVSSTAGAPLPPTTTSFTVQSPLSPMVKSSTNRATPSSSAISSRFRVKHLPTSPSKTEVTLSPIATPWKTRVPRPAKTIFSRTEGPIFMNSQSSRIQPPLKQHRPPASYRQGVPLLLAASSSTTRALPLHIALSSSPGVFMSAVPSSRGNVLASLRSSSSDGVITTAAPSSKDDVLTSGALSSRDGLLNLPYRTPPPYRPRVPPSSVSTSSSTKVPPLQIALSFNPKVFTSAVPSSRADVLTSLAPSSSDGISTSDALSSRDDVLASNALSSRNRLPNLPYRSPPPYTPGAPISTVASSSRAEVSFMPTSPSPSTGVLIPDASFSSTGLPLSPTTPYSRTGVLSPTALSPTASGSNTGVPLSPSLVTSPTRTSVPVTQISPLKCPFSPSKAAYF